MQQPLRIAPSILAADFARLGEDVAAVEPLVDWLHIDVMDGHFVPNIAIGIPIIASLRPHSKLLFDCHLMVTNPGFHFASLQEAGADQVTVHIEAVPEPTGLAAKAHDLDMRFGLVINPDTPAAAIEPFLEMTDVVVVMSVQPGFGGQTFIESVLPKVELLRKSVDSAGLATDIQMDGGIEPSNATAAVKAGADVLVAGSSIFKSEDFASSIANLRAAEGR